MCRPCVRLLSKSQVMWSRRKCCPGPSTCFVFFISDPFIASTGPIPKALFSRYKSRRIRRMSGVPVKKDVAQRSLCRYNDSANARHDRKRSRGRSGSCVRNSGGSIDDEGQQTACSVLKKEIDALHLLVNNAGTNKRIPTLSVSAEDSTETLSFRFSAVSRAIRDVKGCVVIRTGSH